MNAYSSHHRWHARLLLGVLLSAGWLAGCSKSPQQKLADQFAEILRIQAEGNKVAADQAAWDSEYRHHGRVEQEQVYFDQRFHELMDVKFGGPPEIRYSREQHIELINEILAKYHPGMLEELKRGDFGPDGFTREPGGDPKGFVLCEPNHPDKRGDGTAPDVPDKAKACADFYADYIERKVAAPFRLKALVKQRAELGEETDKAEKLLWGVDLDEWGNGAGQKGFDLPATIKGLMVKYHPEVAEDFGNFARAIVTEITPELQNEAKQGLTDFWQAEQNYRDKNPDRKGNHVFWTGDVSGLARLAQEGENAGLLARGIAPFDDAPLRAGDGMGPALPLPSRLSFHFHMVSQDENGNRLALDTDGSGRAWHNPQRFAVCAYPAGYGRMGGRQTYLLDEKGDLWVKDTGGLPVDRLPKDPDAEGWSEAEHLGALVDGGKAATPTATIPDQPQRPAQDGTVPPHVKEEQPSNDSFKRLLFTLEGVIKPSGLIQQQHLTTEQAAEWVPKVLEALAELARAQSYQTPTRQEENLIEYLAEMGPRLANITMIRDSKKIDARSATIELLFSIARFAPDERAPVAARALERITGDAKTIHYLEEIYLTQLAAETSDEKAADLILQLGKLGPQAGGSVPYLNYVLKNSGDPGVQCSAAAALVQITGQSVPGIEFLVRPFQIEPPAATEPPPSGREAEHLRFIAIETLDSLGAFAKPASPDLIRIINSRTADHNAVICAARALVCIGDKPELGLDALRAIIESSDSTNVERALNAVDDLGPLASPLAPSLTKLIESDNGNRGFGILAARALVRVTGKPEIGVSFLVGNLSLQDDSMRVNESIEALGLLGPLAAKAVPALQKLSDSNKDEEQARAIDAALAEIESGIIIKS